MNRKEFIKTCGLACIGSGSIALLVGCSANYYAINSLTNNRISIKKSEFIEVKKDKNVARKFVLVRIERLGFPIYLFKKEDDIYHASLLECTHRGCEVQPNGGQFLQCPCHGSEYSNAGIVQQGPAERDLRTYNTTTDHENIYIQL